MKEWGFEEVLSETKEALMRLYEDLEDAIDYANRMDEEHPEMVRNAIMWAQHVRAYLARNYAILAAEHDYMLEEGFNISLTLHGEKLSFRVLKAQSGQMPSRSSKGREEFFDQLPPPGCRYDRNLFNYEEAEDQTYEKRPSNFVLRWSSECGRLCEMVLGYPKPMPDDAPEDARQEWFWCESVLARLKEAQIEDESRNLTEEEDLGLKRREDGEDEEERGTGTNE